MAIVNGYATLAEVKDSKRIVSVSATDDAFIEGLVEAASRYIDNATGRRFYTTTADETRTFTADGGVVYPGDLLSITTLKTDDDGDRTYETTWTTADYDLLPENAALDGRPYVSIEPAPDGDYGFPTQRKGVQIVGKFGYCALANRPDDINLACTMIVITAYLSRYGNNSEGAATITAAGVVITPRDIPAGAVEIINKYQRDLVP